MRKFLITAIIIAFVTWVVINMSQPILREINEVDSTIVKATNVINRLMKLVYDQDQAMRDMAEGHMTQMKLQAEEKGQYTIEVSRDGTVEWVHVPYGTNTHIILQDNKLTGIQYYPIPEENVEPEIITKE